MWIPPLALASLSGTKQAKKGWMDTQLKKYQLFLLLNHIHH
jgi:hypothetical protein